ncbi:MAG: adenylate kinase family protein [Methanosphaera sp.]|nr:adenylate kinase family protein [Methanosphaera sp.]
MMIIITGTPGCGKTSISNILANKIGAKLISINYLLDNYDLNMGTDELRGYRIVDIDKMIPLVDKIKGECEDETIIFEGHLAQDYPNADKIIVLRCNPTELKKRLDARDWSDRKIQENIEAEILGICTQESYETYGDIVQEVETSTLTPEEVTDIIIDIIDDKKSYPLGQIDYLEEFFHLLD